MARGEAREKAILAAVIGLLGELGYEGMTMDAVAARAHASKTTIYTRWPGKAQLVRAAVDGYVAGRLPAGADTGSLRGDLMAVMQAMAGHLTAEFLAMMSGLVHAMRTDSELAASLRPRFGVGHTVALSIISRAAGRGELPAGADTELAGLAHEVIEAHLLRQMAAGQTLDPEFARHVVDDLVIPVLAAYQKETAMSLASLDKQAVEQFTRHFETLFGTGDAAGLAAFYAPDARLLAENIELIRGRAAIEQFWRHAIGRAQAAGAVRTISLDEVTSSGSLGYALGTVTVRIPPGRQITTKHTTIWQRDADGRWRLAVDSSSPNPAPVQQLYD